MLRVGLGLREGGCVKAGVKHKEDRKRTRSRDKSKSDERIMNRLRVVYTV